ncbi:hypothetical protein ACFE04_005103 [Oxalis oulophora]
MASSTTRVVEVAAFVDTNLGSTHLAMGVSPHITAADFKREFETMHFSCFPKLGEIKVQNLLVKWRMCLYHLPDSMPINHVFQGFKRTWFLHIQALRLNSFPKPSLSNSPPSVAENSTVPHCTVTGLKKSDITSNVINPNPEEVTQNASDPKKRKRRNRESKALNFGCEGSEIGCVTHLAVSTPTKELPFKSPTNINPGSSKSKYERSAVGRRLILAANNLRLSAKKERHASPVLRFGHRKPLECSIPSVTKYLSFEIEEFGNETFGDLQFSENHSSGNVIMSSEGICLIVTQMHDRYAEGCCPPHF